MAATLAWIKSRMLLPPEPGEDDEDGLDPRAELVARLLEYQRFKEAAAGLGELPRLGRDVFRPSVPGVEPLPDEERTIAVGIFELTRLGALRIYQGVGTSGAPEGPIRVRRVSGELAEDWAQRISELM